MRLLAKQIVLFCWMTFIVFTSSSLNAQPEAPVLSLADRWAQNAKELEQETKNLYAMNALLAEENKNLSHQITLLEEKIRLSSKDLQDLNLQKNKPSLPSAQELKNAAPRLQTAELTQEIAVLSDEEKKIRGDLEEESKRQDSLRLAIPPLREEISRLEQKSFLQQRQEQEFFHRFRDADSAAQALLTSALDDQKKLDSSLENMNFFIMDCYTQLKKLTLEQKNLEKDLSARKTALENIDATGEDRDALVAKLVILQRENEGLKNDLAMQRHISLTPKKLIANPRIESLTSSLQVLRADNKSLKSELSRLSQSLQRLNKQKANVEKTLQKK